MPSESRILFYCDCLGYLQSCDRKIQELFTNAAFEAAFKVNLEEMRYGQEKGIEYVNEKCTCLSLLI